MAQIDHNSITLNSVCLRRDASNEVIAPSRIVSIVRQADENVSQASFEIDLSRLTIGEWSVILKAAGALDVDGRTNSAPLILYTFPVETSVVLPAVNFPTAQPFQPVVISLTPAPGEAFDRTLHWSLFVKGQPNPFLNGENNDYMNVALGSFPPGDYELRLYGFYANGESWTVIHDWSIPYPDPTANAESQYGINLAIDPIALTPTTGARFNAATITWRLNYQRPTGGATEVQSGAGSAMIQLQPVSTEGSYLLIVEGNYQGVANNWRIILPFQMVDPSLAPSVTLYPRNSPTDQISQGGTYVKSGFADFTVGVQNAASTGIDVSYGGDTITEIFRESFGDRNWSFRIYPTAETTKEVEILVHLGSLASQTFTFNLESPSRTSPGIYNVLNTDTGIAISNGLTTDEYPINISYRVGNSLAGLEDPDHPGVTVTPLQNLTISVTSFEGATLRSESYGTAEQAAAERVFAITLSDPGTWAIEARYDYGDIQRDGAAFRDIRREIHVIQINEPPPNKPDKPSLFVVPGAIAGGEVSITWADSEPTRTKTRVELSTTFFRITLPNGETSGTREVFARKAESAIARIEIDYDDGTSTFAEVAYEILPAPAPVALLVYFRDADSCWAQWGEPTATAIPTFYSLLTDGVESVIQSDFLGKGNPENTVDFHPSNDQYRLTGAIPAPTEITTYRIAPMWGGEVGTYSNESIYTPPSKRTFEDMGNAPSRYTDTQTALRRAETFQAEALAAQDAAVAAGQDPEMAAVNTLRAGSIDLWAEVLREANLAGDTGLAAIATANRETAISHIDNLIQYFRSGAAADLAFAENGFDAWERYSAWALKRTPETLHSFTHWVEVLGEPAP